MTIEDRLERRAIRVPAGDPREVLAAAQERADAQTRPVRQPQILAAAAAVLAVVALTVAVLAVLSGNGDDSVTVAGPDDPAPAAPDGDWTLIATVRNGERQATQAEAGIRIEGAVVTGTDGCGNDLDTTLTEGALADDVRHTLIACVDEAQNADASHFWRVVEQGPRVEVRDGELWVVADGDALVFQSAGSDGEEAVVTPIPPPRSGAECPGLRSETVWASSGDSGVITAPAGGTATYEETTTNEGSETCSIVWAECPAPGALFTTAGAPLPADSVVCDAIAYPPEDLPPGDSRTETWTVPLTNPPGTYELRVPQRDGTTAVLPITVEEALDACPPGTGELMSVPEFNQYVDRGDTTFAQLQFAETTQRCTIRIVEVVMTLGAADQAGARTVGREFTSRIHRWYLTGPNAGALGEVVLGPIDLPAGQYDGALEVRLANGESFTKLARLLVGDGSSADDTTWRPVPVMWFELVEADRVRLTLGYCGDRYRVQFEEAAEAVTVRAQTSDDPETVAPDCATAAEIGLAQPLGDRAVVDENTGEAVPQR